MKPLAIVVLAAAFQQSFGSRMAAGRAASAQGPQAGPPARISIEAHHPSRVVPLSGALRGPVAIDAADDAVFLTDDGVLGKLARDGTFRWSLLVAPADGAPSLDADGTCYVAGLDGRLYAIDADGKLDWSRPLWGRPVGGVTIGESFVAVALDSGVVRLWDKTSRRIVAQTELGAVPSAAPSLAERELVIPTRDGQLIGVDEHGIRWRSRIATDRLSPAALSGSGLALVGSHGGTLSAVDGRGTIAWSVATGGPIERSPVLDAAGNVYAIAAQSLVAVTPQGAIRWRRPLPGRATAAPLVADDGSIFVAVARPNPPQQVLELGNDGELAGALALSAPPAMGLALQRNQLWVSLRGGALERVRVPQLRLANSGWAKPRGGAMNSGTVAKP